MAVIPKNKPANIAPGSAAQLFDELGELFNKPASIHSLATLTKELEKPLSILRGISQPDREAVQVALCAMWTELDKLAALTSPTELQENARFIAPGLSVAGPGGNASVHSAAVIACEEDEKVRAMLDSARQRETAPMATPASAREGGVALAAMQRASAASLLERIKNKELITSAELQERLGIRRQSLSDAVKSGRLFAMLGPSGENYYPAFYADPALDRRAVEKVAKGLGSLPAASKYFFFTSVLATLHETPLQALAKGRVKEVLVAASTFAAC